MVPYNGPLHCSQHQAKFVLKKKNWKVIIVIITKYTPGLPKKLTLENYIVIFFNRKN